MTTVKLYWSNICILHKQEQQHLKQVQALLKEKEIDLQITYFGLGAEWRMEEYLRQEDAVIPDMIVSTDLEVFEDYRIYDMLKENLYEIADWVPIKKQKCYQRFCQDKRLLPFIAIPFMFYSTQKDCDTFAVRDFVTKPLAFGGIDNSAVKSVLKATWCEYGFEVANAIGEQGIVKQMPIQAMKAVTTGEAQTALVPAVYALRADNEEKFAAVPTDLSIAIPSFVTMSKAIEEDVAKIVLETLITVDFCNLLVKSGNLVGCLEGSDTVEQFDSEEKDLYYPRKTWFEQVEIEKFYKQYIKLIPEAKIPK